MAHRTEGTVSLRHTLGFPVSMRKKMSTLSPAVSHLTIHRDSSWDAHSLSQSGWLSGWVFVPHCVSAFPVLVCLTLPPCAFPPCLSLPLQLPPLPLSLLLPTLLIKFQLSHPLSPAPFLVRHASPTPIAHTVTHSHVHERQLARPTPSIHQPHHLPIKSLLAPAPPPPRAVGTGARVCPGTASLDWEQAPPGSRKGTGTRQGLGGAEGGGEKSEALLSMWPDMILINSAHPALTPAAAHPPSPRGSHLFLISKITCLSNGDSSVRH